MPDMISIAITILKHNNQFLFLKRRKAPYENLWSLVGGKVDLGEHIAPASIREVMEETGTTHVHDYEYRGVVSERLIKPDGSLLAHFLIFVGFARLFDFKASHREGELRLFDESEISSLKDTFLPSDVRMFESFKSASQESNLFEAELVYDGSRYLLNYYREAGT
ncbi:MAG: hypothetical protein BAJATHORv1_10354 [Candidatus Thorarchaeota archaeon]|nr:MAG: hypothetical protein BAJATHORv1_10354 [Candidatus Thorarchaeota archaeon]